MQRYPVPFQDAPEEVFDLYLFKPKALMNVNGPPIVKAAREAMDLPSRLPKQLPNLIALHDELQQPVGRLRHRLGGSHKGHRGLESLATSLSTKDFSRLGLGIDRPEERTASVVSRYVLGPLTGRHLDLVHWDAERQQGGQLLEEAWRAIQEIAVQQRSAKASTKESLHGLAESQRPSSDQAQHQVVHSNRQS